MSRIILVARNVVRATLHERFLYILVFGVLLMCLRAAPQNVLFAVLFFIGGCIGFARRDMRLN